MIWCSYKGRRVVKLVLIPIRAGPVVGTPCWTTIQVTDCGMQNSKGENGVIVII